MITWQYNHTLTRIIGLTLLCVGAWAIRSSIFYYGIMPYERYKQPDSYDYHSAAQCIVHGYGMTRPDTREPIFWRTPGYPAFLSLFYHKYKTYTWDFSQSRAAQHKALWMQIALCSLLPILIFYCALAITGISTIGWIVSAISVVHVGFCLASTYLLTDGLALLFFVMFLTFFYCLVLNRFHSKKFYNELCCIAAALSLSIYTWIRPMGEMVGLLAMLLILVISMHSLRQRTYYALIFGLLFFGTLAPWYVRNYHKTGQLFFCPVTGIYLNSFCAPKIVAREKNISLLDAFRIQQKQGSDFVMNEKKSRMNKDSRNGYHICPQIILPLALEPIKRHPLWFVYDWMTEVIKTTFDLYSSQLVAFVNNCFWYDPLQEFLSEKVKECLYKAPLTRVMRSIAYAELIFYIFIWIGLLGGITVFVIKPFLYSGSLALFTQQTMVIQWLSGFIIAAYNILMTGGFGYARMRIPSEPLMIIFSVLFWYYLFLEKKRKTG